MPPFPLVPQRPLGAAYIPILLSEVEQEQRPCKNGDREDIVLGAGLCDGESERAYTVYDPILGEEKYPIYFKRFAGAKTGYGTICWKTICRKTICRNQFAEREDQFVETQFAEREGQFAENYSANCL